MQKRNEVENLKRETSNKPEQRGKLENRKQEYGNQE
jgi:hypothetical protein